MDSEQISEHQTVLIKDGRISEIGVVGEIEIPAGAEVIQSNNACLMPGLADMHTHLSDFDPDPEHLILYLANGVTTLRSLNTPWKIMKWRDKVNSGELLGPTIYLSGPCIAGVPPDAKMLALGLRTGLWLIFFLVGILILGLTWVILNKLIGPDVGKIILDQWLIPWLIVTALLGIILIWRKSLPLTPLAALIIPYAAVVETTSQARAAVKKQVKAGVEFIKPYDY